MEIEQRVRDAFAVQAKWCSQLGSPFTALLMEVLGARLDRQSQAGQLVLDWPGQPDAHGDSVPLRLAGALHALVRRGQAVALAKLYPPHALPKPDMLAKTVSATLEANEGFVCNWLQLPPQTNEVARSGVLYPGLMQIAEETGLPLAIYEAGASAGLNLNMDKYGYQLGGQRFGSADAAVSLHPVWHGDPPPGTMPVIVERRGCDRSPFDVQDSEQMARLISYVWPDQPERLARIQAACEIAHSFPPVIDTSDAADWVEDIFDKPTTNGVTRVLYHSIAYQYFPAESQARIEACMARAGEAATAKAPVAWLAFEQVAGEGPTLTLRLWPGGIERVLAHCDAHCREITWLA